MWACRYSYTLQCKDRSLEHVHLPKVSHCVARFILNCGFFFPSDENLFWLILLQAIQQMQNKSPPPSQMSHALPMDLFLASSAMDVYKSLIRDLEAEGRYLVLNAIANQLRYPNNHTHYFSFVLLFLFAEANQVTFLHGVTSRK